MEGFCQISVKYFIFEYVKREILSEIENKNTPPK